MAEHDKKRLVEADVLLSKLRVTQCCDAIIDGEIGDAIDAISELRDKLAAAEARIAELEAALPNTHKCAECGSEETYIVERRGAPGRDKAPQALEPAGEAPYIPGPEAEELP